MNGEISSLPRRQKRLRRALAEVCTVPVFLVMTAVVTFV